MTPEFIKIIPDTPADVLAVAAAPIKPIQKWCSFCFSPAAPLRISAPDRTSAPVHQNNLRRPFRNSRGKRRPPRNRTRPTRPTLPRMPDRLLVVGNCLLGLRHRNRLVAHHIGADPARDDGLIGFEYSPPSPRRACRKVWLSLFAAYKSCTSPSSPARSKSASLVFTSLQVDVAFLVAIPYLSFSFGFGSIFAASSSVRMLKTAPSSSRCPPLGGKTGVFFLGEIQPHHNGAVQLETGCQAWNGRGSPRA